MSAKTPTQIIITINEESEECDLSFVWDSGNFNPRLLGTTLGMITSKTIIPLVERRLIERADETNDQKSLKEIVSAYQEFNKLMDDMAEPHSDMLVMSPDYTEYEAEGYTPEHKQEVYFPRSLKIKFEKVEIGEPKDIQTDEDVVYSVPGLGIVTPSQLKQMQQNHGPKMPDRDFFLGYTNFTITRGVWSVISHTPGVEIAKAMSSYTFMVSFANGVFFDDFEVKNRILKRVKKYVKQRRI